MLPHRVCAQYTNLQFDCEAFVCPSLSDTEVPGCRYPLQIHYRSKVNISVLSTTSLPITVLHYWSVRRIG